MWGRKHDVHVDSLVVLIWVLVPVLAYAVGLVAVRRHAPLRGVDQVTVGVDPVNRLEQLRAARRHTSVRTGRQAEARRLAETGALTDSITR